MFLENKELEFREKLILEEQAKQAAIEQDNEEEYEEDYEDYEKEFEKKNMYVKMICHVEVQCCYKTLF